MDESVTVVCVKVGDRYSAEYVNRLAQAVRRNLEMECWFVCATEDPSGIQEPMVVVPPPKNLPGWWAKLGLFQEKAFGSVEGRLLYLDLDVVITGPLDDLVRYPTRFAMHRDFTRPLVNASAVMVLDSGAASGVWKTFSTTPGKYMERHKAGGDQEFLTRIHPAVDLLPARWVVSYKRQAMGGPPKDARVVCFHGKPKPHECGGWVKEQW
jgi:hypothetical protein